MYRLLLKMKFNRGFWLGYIVASADAVILITLYAWRAEILSWLVN